MMSGVAVHIRQKAGEHDQLFGSVTAQDIADALAKQGYTIERKKIQLDEPIKQIGEYKVALRLHREVSAEITVHVDKEE
ncbi:MAG TPA: 50S ribosomal protein L9 [Nitrospira sp.]|nr:50S ribosomal protein L9 [Nitrospira sp.]